MRRTLFTSILTLLTSFVLAQAIDPMLHCSEPLTKQDGKILPPQRTVGGRLLNVAGRDKTSYLQERGSDGKVVLEHALNLSNDREGFYLSHLISTRSTVGLFGSLVDRKTEIIKPVIALVDPQDLSIRSHEAVETGPEPDINRAEHYFNRWITSADGSHIAHWQEYADKKGSQSRFLLFDEDLKLKRHVKITHSNDARERIESAALADNGDLFVITSSGEGFPTSAGTFELIAFPIGGDERTTVKLALDHPLVDDLAIVAIGTSTIRFAGILRDGARKELNAFACELDRAAFTKGDGTTTNWQQVPVVAGSATGHHPTDLRHDLVWQPVISAAGSLVLVGQRWSEWVSYAQAAGSNARFVNCSTTDLYVLRLTTDRSTLDAVLLPSAISTSIHNVIATQPCVQLSSDGVIHVIMNETKSALEKDDKDPQRYSFIESTGSTVHWKIGKRMEVERSILAPAKNSKEGVLFPWLAVMGQEDGILIPKQRYGDPIRSFCTLSLK